MSKQNTNTELLKVGDFETLLCKANQERNLHRASLEVKQFKINTIKKTPLLKEVMREIGVDTI
jgi:hypothetical protein